LLEFLVQRLVALLSVHGLEDGGKKEGLKSREKEIQRLLPRRIEFIDWLFALGHRPIVEAQQVVSQVLRYHGLFYQKQPGSNCLKNVTTDLASFA
jgi:hypothetical protein